MTYDAYHTISRPLYLDEPRLKTNKIHKIYNIHHRNDVQRMDYKKSSGTILNIVLINQTIKLDILWTSLSIAQK